MIAYQLSQLDFRVERYSYEHIFDEEGKVHPPVFDRIIANLNKKSSPGYPYPYASTTGMLIDEYYDILYRDFSNWLRLILTTDLTAVTREDLVKLSLVPPASMFVKGEPTKIGKIARLIFGVPVWVNMLGRLLFQDLLIHVPQTWRTQFHKVGMDMYTEDGVDDIYQVLSFINNISLENNGTPAISDDIQGWEYQVRDWMHAIFHEELAKRYSALGATSFRLTLMWKYYLVETYMTIIDSDGHVLIPRFYFQFSGKLLTHYENSVQRAALAYVDHTIDSELPDEEVIAPLFYAATNGDDCVCATNSIPQAQLKSESWGFVHTDKIEQGIDGNYHFSSQIFYLAPGGRPQRRPDGLSKLFANFLESTSEESDDGILNHLPLNIQLEFRAARNKCRESSWSQVASTEATY